MTTVDEPGLCIHHYFHFSITFSTLLIHYYAPRWHNLPHEPPWLLTCDVLAFTSLDQPRLFNGHMMYNSHVYSSPFSYLMHPPMAQPIMNHCTAQSGTYYSFTSDEPCAHFLVYHLYLTCPYLPFAPENCIYKVPPVCRFSAFTSPHICLTPFHITSHCLAVPLSLPVTPYPDHTLIAS